MNRIALFCFGTPRLVIDGQPVPNLRRKSLALLVYLAVTQSAPSRETLAALFWPENDTSGAFAYLRRTLWELNHLIGDGIIESNQGHVTIKSGEIIWLDVAELNRLVKHSEKQATTQDNLELFEQAERLYRADFLAGFNLPDSTSFEEWQFFQKEELQRTYAKILDCLTANLRKNGAFRSAIEVAQCRLALDPLNEAIHLVLMQLHRLIGDRSAALRQYENCRQLLEKELGIAPQAEIQEYYNQIKSGKGLVTLVDQTVGAEQATILNPKSNLPMFLTPFIGRNRELADVENLLRDSAARLITILGPGGIGKTRLVTEAAARVQNSFPDGVYFISLAGLLPGDSIMPEIEKVFHYTVREETGIPQQGIYALLRRSNALLVMDNFEHLVNPDNLNVILELLATTGGIKIIITSRASLNALGENLYPLSGLNAPDLGKTNNPILFSEDRQDLQEFSSLELFTVTARRCKPEFLLDSENIVVVAQICELLEGVPLAIELAASWIDVLDVGEILTEIRHNLDFLEKHLHGLPDRQSSLRVVFNASWNQLSEAEQQVFQKLAIFKGSFSRHAAQIVAGASLSDLVRLSGKSLIQRVGNNRYAVHELVRQYAVERLIQSRSVWLEVQERYCEYYLDYFVRYPMQLSQDNQKDAVEQLLSEIDDIRIAWTSVVENQEYERLSPALYGLLLFTFTHGYASGFAPILDETIKAIEKTGPAPELRIPFVKIILLWVNAILEANFNYSLKRLSYCLEMVRKENSGKELGIWYSLLGNCCYRFMDPLEGIRIQQESLQYLRESGSSQDIALALTMLVYSPDPTNPRSPEAIELVQEAIQRFEVANNPYGLAFSLQALANIHQINFEFEPAIDAMERTIQIYIALEDAGNIALSYFGLGMMWFGMGDFEKALQYFRRTQEIAQRDPALGWIRMFCLYWESIINVRHGDIPLARKQRSEILKYELQSNDHAALAWSYLELGDIERIAGNYAEAQRLFDSSWRHSSEVSITVLPAFYQKSLGDLSFCLNNFDVSLQHFKQSVKLALDANNYWCHIYALVGVGRVLIRMSELVEARGYFVQALRMMMTTPDRMMRFVLLTGLAEYFAATNDYEQAEALCSYVTDHPSAWYEMKILVKQVHQNIVGYLSADDLANARLRYAEQDPELVIFELVQILLPSKSP